MYDCGLYRFINKFDRIWGLVYWFWRRMMKLVGVFLVMGILVVLMGVNDGFIIILEDVGEELSIVVGDIGREFLLLFGYYYVLISYYYYL